MNIAGTLLKAAYNGDNAARKVAYELLGLVKIGQITDEQAQTIANVVKEENKNSGDQEKVQVVLTTVYDDDTVVVRQFNAPLVKSDVGAASFVNFSRADFISVEKGIKGHRIEFYSDGKWYEQSANGVFLKSGYDIDFPEDK